MNPIERREFAELVNDLTIDMVARLNDAIRRHAEQVKLMEGTITRLNFQIRELTRQLEEHNDAQDV